MVKLFAGRIAHLLLNRRISGDGGMSLVQALCRDFSGVVYAHQAGRMGLFMVVQIGLRQISSWICASRSACGSGNSGQGIVYADKKTIQRVKYAFVHRGHYTFCMPLIAPNFEQLEHTWNTLGIAPYRRYTPAPPKPGELMQYPG